MEKAVLDFLFRIGSNIKVKDVQNTLFYLPVFIKYVLK